MITTIDFNPLEDNFWELNPQVSIISPFAALYKRDKSHKKTNSSKEMWCVVFMSEANPEKNKLYRLPQEEIKKEIEENYFKINWNDKLVQECIDKYPEKCMSTIAQLFKVWEDKLHERNKFLRDTPYNEENHKTLEAILQKSKIVTDAYKQAYDDLMVEGKKLKGKGDRSLSKAEKGEI